MKIILIFSGLFFAFFGWALCAIAGRADRAYEKLLEEKLKNKTKVKHAGTTNNHNQDKTQDF